jgi:hypothetical protein
MGGLVTRRIHWMCVPIVVLAVACTPIAKNSPAAQSGQMSSTGLAETARGSTATGVPGVPTCTFEQLRATALDKGSNLGNGGILFTLHNGSSTACQLIGYPRLLLIGPKGRLLDTNMQEATDGAYLFPAIPANLIVLSPGADASFQAAYAAIPFGSQADDPVAVACPSTEGVRITLPGSQEPVDISLQVAACGGWLSVSPVFPGSEWLGY